MHPRRERFKTNGKNAIVLRSSSLLLCSFVVKIYCGAQCFHWGSEPGGAARGCQNLSLKSRGCHGSAKTVVFSVSPKIQGVLEFEFEWGGVPVKTLVVINLCLPILQC